MSLLGTPVFANPTTPIWASATPLTQYGTVASAGGTGNTLVTLGTPYASATSYVVMVAMEDTNPAQMSVNRVSANSFRIYWANAGGGAHTLAWFTIGA